MRQVGHVCWRWNHDRRQLERRRTPLIARQRHGGGKDVPKTPLPAATTAERCRYFTATSPRTPKPPKTPKLRGRGARAAPLPHPPGVEDVVARQTLGARHHLLAADDADVVHGLQLFRRGVGVAARGGELGGKRRKKKPQSNPFPPFSGGFEGDVGR